VGKVIAVKLDTLVARHYGAEAEEELAAAHMVQLITLDNQAALLGTAL
jgi:hypothetical protein